MANNKMQAEKHEVKVLAAVMLGQASTHPWGEHIWSLAGVIPGLSQTELTALEAKGELHHWPDLSLELFVLHCDAYYQNLMSGDPQLYLVSQQDEQSVPKPLLITVDYDEAASYMETGEQVFYTPLPPALITWLEAFVLTHYQPEKLKKRKRKKWHKSGN